jgi:uncharacterized protein (TIGR02453 family)
VTQITRDVSTPSRHSYATCLRGEPAYRVIVEFTGIPQAAVEFYDDLCLAIESEAAGVRSPHSCPHCVLANHDLEADNTKAFWTAHKQVYDEQVKAPLAALATALEPEFGAPKIFRPYRDVRFAKDKTPYKTHQGIWFGESSRYLHISAAGLFVAAGYWDTSPGQVDRLRRAVADDVAGPALDRALATVGRAHFEVGGHQLTRVPAGYPKDHPRADLLRYKSLTAHREFGCPPWLATKRAQQEIGKAFRTLAPLVSWLDTHVGRD